MVENWEKLDSETLADYRIFQIRKDSRRSPRTGKVYSRPYFPRSRRRCLLSL